MDKIAYCTMASGYRYLPTQTHGKRIYMDILFKACGKSTLSGQQSTAVHILLVKE